MCPVGGLIAQASYGISPLPSHLTQTGIPFLASQTAPGSLPGLQEKRVGEGGRNLSVFSLQANEQTFPRN